MRHLVHDRRSPLPDGPWDVVVVGAGIYGLPCAYFLARHAGARVLVVEDNAIPGEGITVNTGGIIRVAYSNLDVARVAAFARAIYREPTRRLRLTAPTSMGFVPTGWGRFVNADAVPGVAEEIHRIAAGVGAGMQVRRLGEYLADLSPGRRRNVEAILDVTDSTHVLVDEKGGFADGGTALLGWQDACLEACVCIALYAPVLDFVRDGSRIAAVVVDRSRDASGVPESIRATRVVLAAGRNNAALVRAAAGWEMPTFTSFHQLAYVRNSADLDFASRVYDVGEGAGRRQVELIDAPTISHWRDIYFRPEGMGMILGTHHRELQADDYRPRGGEIGGMRVGLDQTMVSALLELMPYFPILSSPGLNLGRTPDDIAGGAYYMNPEELPFEGEVPGTEGSVLYAGSGCGTGFKLGPGVAWLLTQRMMGVPLPDRLIASAALSAERATYFYPPGTSRDELLAQFRPLAEGGRLVEMGAAGIAVPPL